MSQIKILLVDDEPLESEILSVQLQTVHGYDTKIVQHFSIDQTLNEDLGEFALALLDYSCVRDENLTELTRSIAERGFKGQLVMVSTMFPEDAKTSQDAIHEWLLKSDMNANSLSRICEMAVAA